MKFKTLPIIRYYASSLIIILFFLIPVSFVLFGIFSEYVSQDIKLPFVAIASAFLVFCICFVQFAFWEKCFSSVLIEHQRITWCCPFRKSISIVIEDCIQIGLEFENAYVKGVYAYIYFVTFPYSQANSEYYGKVKCTDGLIKIRYSNQLAKFLIANYSQKTSYNLCEYYRNHKKDKWLF